MSRETVPEIGCEDWKGPLCGNDALFTNNSRQCMLVCLFSVLKIANDGRHVGHGLCYILKQQGLY